MRKNADINIFEDGQESRDFVHVSDVVMAIQLALEADLSSFTVANIGSGVPTTVLEVAGLLGRLLGSTSKLQITGDFRAGDIRHCYSDGTVAQSVLGFTPAVSLEKGLKGFCDWVVTQPVLEDRSKQAQQEMAKAGLGKSSA